tara:strand:- start:1028 stop:1525 length:498 start_codon:yes stop_codon:yes gene_type:complete
MFDTMTITKIAAGVLGAWLVLLLGKWAAEELYSAELHGEASYVVEVEGAADAEPEEEIDLVAMMAAADADKGSKVFRKCSACHKVDGTDGVGPHLDGVVDRAKASVDGFGYSGGLGGMEGSWTVEALNGFLENPKGYAPGTTMGFAGLKKPADRANVIAYLQSLQ